MKNKTIMLFNQFANQKINEEGDGGGGGGDAGGGEVGTATPSNTPGMGNPDTGGASGDSASSLGSGDTWNFGEMFPNYMNPKKRKKKRIKNKGKKKREKRRRKRKKVSKK